MSKPAIARAHSRWGHAKIHLPPVPEKPAGKACKACPLRERTCVHTEFAEEPKLAIVGEAPGFNELQEGRPFIGASGKYLQHALSRFGWARHDVTWTNAVPCEVRNEKELKEALKHCARRLQRELKGITHILPVGAFAVQSLFGLSTKPSILKKRGFVYRDGDRTIVPTVHPAFVLRSPLWQPVFASDLDRLHRISKEGWLPPEKMHGRRRVIVKSVGALRRELKKLGRVVSIDVETTEEAATYAKLLCFSLTEESTDNTVVVPWSTRMDGSGRFFGSQQGKARDIVNNFLSTRRAITHNGPAFDHIVLANHDIFVGAWDDTLIAHHTYASHMPQRLSHVVSVYLDAPPWKDQREDTIKDLYRYNSQDTLYTQLSWNSMQKELERERRIYEIDCVSAELCRDMQQEGFRFDVSRAKKLQRLLSRKTREATQRAQSVLGHEINLASHKQLSEAFFDEIDAPIFFRSEKTDAPGLGAVALQAYAAYSDERLSELAQATIDFRKANKVNGTYIKPMLTGKVRLDENQRIHPTWKSYGTVSGRYSCSGPNLMNLPRLRSDPCFVDGHRLYEGIRSLYIPRKGNVLVGFDAKQLEMRIMAYASGDRVMIKSCESADMHDANAIVLFGDAYKKAKGVEKKHLRTITKTSGFAAGYGAVATTVLAWILGQGLPMTLGQVEALLAKMHEQYWEYYEWQEELLHRTMRLGYVETPFEGRKRYTGHHPQPNEVKNLPIQGGAADHLNRILPKVVDAVPTSAVLVAQVHDQGILDVPERQAHETAAIIREIAEEPVELNGRRFVLPVDIHIADRWSSLDRDDTKIDP